jgi:predicted enzyme related to lactoylglutathione lyase
MPDRNEYTPGTPSWVDLGTSDGAAAKRFYTTLFGWDYEDNDMGGGEVYSMATKRGRHVAGLMQRPGPVAWATYVASTDADATTAAATKAGGTVLMPVTDVQDAGRMSIVQDPTGAVIGIWQAKNHIGAGVVNEAGAFSWSELMTPALDKASKFYKQVFGWDAQPFEGMDYTVFVNGEQGGIGGAPNSPMEGAPPHWLVYFNVDDTDATVATAKKAGGNVVAEPFDIPQVGRIAVLADPQGGAFAVMQPEQQPA